MIQADFTGVAGARNYFARVIKALGNRGAIGRAMDSMAELTVTLSRDEAPKDTFTLSKSQGYVSQGLNRIIFAKRRLLNPKSKQLAFSYAIYAHEHHPYYDIVVRQRGRLIANLGESQFLQEIRDR